MKFRENSTNFQISLREVRECFGDLPNSSEAAYSNQAEVRQVRRRIDTVSDTLCIMIALYL